MAKNVNIAGRANIVRAINVGKPGTIQVASSHQDGSIVQRDGVTLERTTTEHTATEPIAENSKEAN